MKAEFNGGQLYILPESVAECKYLVEFGKANTPESLSQNLRLVVPGYALAEEVKEAPVEEAPAPAPVPEPVAPAPTPEKRGELVKLMLEKGWREEDLKGKRTSTLVKMLSNEPPPAPPAAPPPPAAPEPVAELNFAKVKELCAKHIHVFGEPSFKKVLDTFGAPMLSSVPEEKYTDFIGALTAEAAAVKAAKESECQTDSLLG